MGFQTKVNRELAPAVSGDFASANPRASTLSEPGGFVANMYGVVIGKFAWRYQNSNPPAANPRILVNTIDPTLKLPVAGFVGRAGQPALITDWMGESTMKIPGGLGVTVYCEGDFWAVNSGPDAANIDQPVYARFSDGAIITSPLDPTLGILTKFKTKSSGAVGELIIISTLG